jgi:RNA polymerase sigma-70 factor (ECF subfamily)
LAGNEADILTRGPRADGDAAVEVAMRAAIDENVLAVRRFLFGMCADWDQAEDFAQEAMMKAWTKRASFDGRSSAKTWIFTIARNHWLDSLRRKRVRPNEQTIVTENLATRPGDSPPARAARGEFMLAVSNAMGNLPPEQREVLAMRESQSLTFRQVADVLGIPLATAKSRARYALLKLADELRPFSGELE